MNTTMRTRLFSLFLNLVMFVSFNLGGFTNVYAEGTEPTYENTNISGIDAASQDCEETDPSATGGAYIYKAGCKFQEDKTATETWTPKTVNKILMGLMAVVAIASAAYTYDPVGKMDCPGNIAASITLPAIVAGSIAYIAGEIQANIRYKSAAKKATDVTFSGQKTDNVVENNKQLEAFDNLIEIYEEQIRAANTKKALSIVGQVGYTAAAGVEIANLLLCKAQCKSTWAAQNTIATGSLSTITATSATCPGAIAFTSGFTGLVASATAKDSAFTAAIVAEQTEAASQMTSFFSSIAESATSTIPNLGTIKDMAVRMSKASINATMNQSSSATLTSLATAVAIPNPALVLPPAIAAATALCSATSATAHGLVQAITRTPVLCCGVDSSPNTTWLMNPAGLSKLGSQKDIYFVNVLGSAIEGKIIKNDSIEKKKIDEMTTLVAYNAVYENASNEILKSNLSKEKKLEKLANLSKELDGAFNYLNKNIDGFTLPNQIEVQDQLAESLFGGDTKKFSQIMNEISNNFKLTNAYADGGWMKVLGWAGSILVLRAALKQIYTKIAGTTPKSRSIYFTLLAGIGGYVLSQDIKTVKELKKRKEAIEKEREKFNKAASSNSILEEGGLGNDALNLKAGNYDVGTRGLGNYPGCIAATGKTYGPVNCPSLIKRDAVKIPQLNDKTRKLVSNAHVNSLGTLEDVAFNAASGSYLDNPNLLTGSLGSASGNLNAMRAHNDKLRKKLDELEKGQPKIKDKSGREVKPLSLSEMHDNLMNSFGNGSSILPAELAEDLGTSEKEEVEETKVASVPKGIPLQTGGAPSSDFNIDLGLDEEKEMNFDNNQASGEQKLEDFVVEQNDISKKTEVSIFKILSNRYLLSYPKVLEEKKK